MPLRSTRLPRLAEDSPLKKRFISGLRRFKAGGPSKISRCCGRPSELLTKPGSAGIGRFSFLGDPGTSSQNPRGRQKGCRRLSISIPALRFFAERIESDRVIILKESDRGRARRRELHRRTRPPAPSLVASAATSCAGSGGRGLDTGGFGGGRGFFNGESTNVPAG